jgi:hypothetical protein
MAKTGRIPIFPRPGIYRGATADASAGRWFDCNLMRWRGGQAQPVGGSAAVAGILLGAAGRDALTWHDNEGARWGAFGTDTKLYALNFSLGELYDITPAGVGPLEPPGAPTGYGLADYGEDAYGTARDPADIGVIDVSAIMGDMWSLDLFGEDLLVLPTQSGTLCRWSPNDPTTPAAPVPGAPQASAAVVVTDERHVVLLGANGNARQVAWSDQENPDVWIAAVDNLAGDKMLETEGRPLNAMRVASGVLIWTDNDVHLMRYVGPPYAYGINKIGSNCGPISRRAMSQAGGLTTWMSTQAFWQYDGTLSPLASDVGDWMFSLLNRDYVGRVFAAPNPAFTEHWWYWPSEDSSECNRYVAFNYGDANKPWMIGQQARTAADVRGAMVRPILCDGAGHVLIHEYGWTDNGASRASQVYLETGAFTLSEAGEQRFHVKQIAQDFTGPSDRVGYRFFIAEEPNGEEDDTGVFPVTNNSGLTDAKFSTRGLRMRIEALSDGPFAIGKSRLIVRPGGFR